MSRLVVAATAAVVLALGFGHHASAADMAVKAPVADAAYNWTGWYVGGNAGYVWGNSSVNYVQDPGLSGGFGVTGLSGLALNTSPRPDSFTAGVQHGYDLQFDRWLVGGVADFNYRKASGQTVTGPLNLFGDFLTVSTDQQWLGTVRGRVGFIPANSWLVYATGGFAYGRVNHSLNQTIVVPPNVTRVLTTGLTKTGWTAGAGAEYRLNRNWSVGAEYLYVDLGADSLAAGPSTAPVGNVPAGAWPATRATFKDVSNILRATLNYRFN